MADWEREGVGWRMKRGCGMWDVGWRMEDGGWKRWPGLR